MPLAHRVRGVAVGRQHRRHHRLRRRECAPCIRGSPSPGDDAAHPNAVVVAPGEHAGACRRTQRGGVERRVAQATGREGVDVGRGRCRNRSSRVGRSPRRRGSPAARWGHPPAGAVRRATTVPESHEYRLILPWNDSVTEAALHRDREGQRVTADGVPRHRRHLVLVAVGEHMSDCNVVCFNVLRAVLDKAPLSRYNRVAVGLGQRDLRRDQATARFGGVAQRREDLVVDVRPNAPCRPRGRRS